MDNNKVHLNMRKISIEFPGVKALTDVDFGVSTGEIHALIGANGAGKSTLMKVLAGANAHYTGEIYIDGKPIEIRSPKEAKNHKIQIVYQEVDTALIPYLSVAENVVFDDIVNNMARKQIVNWKYVRKTAEEVLKRLHIDLNVRTLVSDLTLAQKQMVLIARCIVSECRFLILDEPTAPLSNTETGELFRIVRDLAANHNVGVIFISHRLNELFEICEHITVMRDGKIVKNLPITKELTISQIVEYMLGRKMDEVYPKQSIEIGDVFLEVDGLSEKTDKVRDINMYVRRGEIVGIAGLVGAGKTELCKTLFGALKQYGGTIRLNGKKLKIKNAAAAVKQGLALVPEERRREGVLVSDPVYSNLSVASLGKYTGVLSVVDQRRELADAKKMVLALGIKTPDIRQKVALLSGGNQQKVAVGKWLNSDSELFIFDEPTKGVDVGAKQDIFKLIEELAAQGKGIIYASCEFQEILSITDRTYVMCNGNICKELTTADTNEKELLYYSTGGV